MNHAEVYKKMLELLTEFYKGSSNPPDEEQFLGEVNDLTDEVIVAFEGNFDEWLKLNSHLKKASFATELTGEAEKIARLRDRMSGVTTPQDESDFYDATHALVRIAERHSSGKEV